jgi:hypothetical protein
LFAWRSQAGTGGRAKALPEVAGEIGTGKTDAAPPVGGDSEAQRFVQRRRRAEAGGLAILAASDVLEGDLESGAVCGRAKSLFGAKVWVQKSQAAGHPRSPRGFAKYAMNAKPERNRAKVDALKRLQADTTVNNTGQAAAELGARYFFRPPVVRKS